MKACFGGHTKGRSVATLQVEQRQCRQSFRINGNLKGVFMNNIVYIVGAVVIVLAILSFIGFR
jgi:hypothetical protein